MQRPPGLRSQKRAARLATSVQTVLRRAAVQSAIQRSILSAVLLLLQLVVVQPSHAQALPGEKPLAIPEALKPWVPWVLHGHEGQRCTSESGGTTPLCAWPAALSLELDDKGGRFTLDVVVERDMYVALPGSATRFPQEVALDDATAVVLEGPRAFVPSGNHRITGRFDWNSLPESLDTPPQVGLLNLRIRGRRVNEPRRDASGNLWLQSTSDSAEDEKRLEIRVHRRLQDGVPLRITTRIELSVGGRAREVVLAKAPLPGTLPIDIASDLPVRLEPDGRLRVQVVAGEHRITLSGVAPEVPNKLSMPTPDGPWPEQEVWVWAAEPSFRQVEVSGGTRVEPGRTNLESDWHGMPTFILRPGDALTMETRRRGDSSPAPNHLALAREVWLDEDGGHFTVRDALSGTLHDNFRLDLAAGQLGRVHLQTEGPAAGQDQLITAYSGHSGVEIRSSALNMQAEWRLPRSGATIPAVAWDADIDSLNTVLHLPPGWSLFHAQGADTVQGTTLSHWDLWSFFFVLLVTLSAAKLRGPLIGLLGLLTLVLCYHEPLAPELLWLWLLGAMALTRAPLNETGAKFARWFLWAAVATIALWSLPFVIHQVRSALYPQLESDAGYVDTDYLSPASAPKPRDRFGIEGPNVSQPEAPAEASEAAAPLMLQDESSDSYDISSKVSRREGGRAGWKQRSTLTEVDPNALTQTGPGVPNWRHHSYSLSWSGPVGKEQRLTLWLLPPWLHRSLALLRVLLLGLFFVALLSEGDWKGRGPKKTANAPPPADDTPATRAGSRAKAAVSALVLLTLLCTATARAQQQTQLAEPGDAGGSAASATSTPSPELLRELRKRLLAEADCEGPCVSAADMTLTLTADRLTIRARVHAGAPTTYRAPGPLSAWSPDTVRVDDDPHTAAARLNDGFLHVRLAPGAHIVEMSGPTPGADALTLQLGTPPHRINVQAREWEIDGLRNDGSANDTIALRRRVARAESQDAPVSFPPWLLVRRRFEFGLQFRVETQIERLGNVSQALLVRYPLLPHEEVTQAHIEGEDGFALIRLEAGQRQELFASTLRLEPQLTLKTSLASEGARYPFSETWELDCSPLYRCVAEGLGPQSRVSDGQVVATYQPLPGEQLNLQVQRLQGAEGASTTIDNAVLSWTPGERITTAELALTVRSSGGATVQITLPPQARLGAVHIDEQARSAQLQNGVVELTMEPGQHHVQLPFKLDLGLTAFFRAPEVKIGGELVNAKVLIHVPDNRWLLWAGGPAWGPAILFWGYLFTALIIALGLSRVPNSPLRLHQWALLALGLAQVSPVGASVVVLWFFAMWARSKHVPAGHMRFNLAQVALLLLSLATIITLIEAVRRGLLLRPDMQVAGRGSGDGQLSWYVDRVHDAMPRPAFLSVPLWLYKGLMLLWALWLASSTLNWLRWGYAAFSHGGRFKPLRAQDVGSGVTAHDEHEEATVNLSPNTDAPTSDNDDKKGD